MPMTRVELRDGKKSCSHCGQWLDLDQFGPMAKGPFGRSSVCRTCKNAQQRGYARLHQRSRSARLAARAGPLAGRRSCLQCGRMFQSSGPGNRICWRHAEAALPAPRRALA
jgi:hypothetical protein